MIAMHVWQIWSYTADFKRLEIIFIFERKQKRIHAAHPKVPVSENKMTNNDFDFLLFANETFHRAIN